MKYICLHQLNAVNFFVNFSLFGPQSNFAFHFSDKPSVRFLKPEQPSLTQANQVYDFKISNLTPGKTYTVGIKANFLSKTGIETEYNWPKNMVRDPWECNPYSYLTTFLSLKTVSLSTPPATPTAPYLGDEAVLAWSEVGGAQRYQLQGQRVIEHLNSIEQKIIARLRGWMFTLALCLDPSAIMSRKQEEWAQLHKVENVPSQN